MSKNCFSLSFFLAFLLIISIKISLNKKQSLVLPYKIYYPPLDTKSTKDEIFLSFQRNYFYTLFEIGNPTKKIPMFYTFNNSEISFYSDSKFLSILEESSYIPSNSESFKNLENKIVQEELLFNINNENYTKPFRFINSDSNEKDLNYYSFIGLQNFYNENLKKKVLKPNFLYQLKKLGLINYISFSINHTSEDEGFININLEPNEYAPQLYSNKNKYIAQIRTLESRIINSMSGALLWSLEISLAYYKNKQRKKVIFNIDHYELNEDQYAVLVNPAYGYIRAPFDYKNSIKKDFFDEFIKNNICSISIVNKIHYYTCNAKYKEQLKAKFPTLYFYYPVKKYNFTYDFELNFEDLFYEHKGILYFLVIYDSTIFGNDKFAQISEWVLGKPFLDKYQFSFDVEKKQISFYENKNGYGKKNIKKIKIEYLNINNKNLNQRLNVSELLTNRVIFISIALFIFLIIFFCISYKIRAKNLKFVEEGKMNKDNAEFKETLKDANN